MSTTSTSIGRAHEASIGEPSVREPSPTVRAEPSASFVGEPSSTVRVEPSASHADAPTRREPGRSPPAPRRLLGDALAPTRMGRYVVLRKLGEGGMGVVLAAYDEELDRRVAIKVLFDERAGDGSRGTLHEQLRREAQALARLSHPNVVAVYEVGQDAGRVFMAMELVQGDGLHHAAARVRQAQGWRGVVGLFQQAGRGLAAAHDAGLVHRDFKPANAIVDEHGRVRVLDFGLARALEPGPAAATTEGPVTEDMDRGASASDDDVSVPGVLPTVAGVVVGTPVYMSPEQHVGLPLDARSDQFSFCVALWECLYGQRPYAAESLPELLHKVRAGVPDSPPAGARVPAWLRRVALRGLRPDPHERWPSMHALLHALDRGVDRRRPWAVGGAALAVALAGLAWARTPSPTAPCADTRAQLEGAWNDESRQRLHDAVVGTARPGAATTWATVESTLDAYVDDWVAMYTEACGAHHRGEQSDELYDLRVACLDGRRDALQEVVDVLGRDPAGAIEHAVPMAMRLPGLDACADVEALTAQVALPESLAEREQVTEIRRRLSRVRALEQSEHYEEGLALVEEVLREARALGYAPVLAEALSWQGSLLQFLGRYEPAERALTEGFLAALGSGHDEYAVNTARMLVYLLATRHGRYDEAEHWGRLAGAILQRGRVSPRVEATYHNAMGTLHNERGQYAEAKQQSERALEIYRRIFPPDHPETAVALSNLGHDLQYLGDLDGARELLEAALQMDTRLLGPNSAAVAAQHLSLGYLALERKDYAEARRAFEQARAAYLVVLGPEHPDLAYVDKGLGRAAEGEGDLVGAARHFEAALALRRRLYGDDHMQVSEMESELADVEIATGKLHAAKDRLVRVVRAYDANRAHGNLHHAWALYRLARLQRLLGEPTAAIASLRQTLEVTRAHDPNDHQRIAAVEMRLAQLARITGDPEAASRLLDAAEATVAKMDPPDPEGPSVELATERAELLLAAGKAAQAHALLAPLQHRLNSDVEPDDRAAARFVLARAAAVLPGTEAEVRRLAAQAVEDLTAAHLTAQAEEVSAWLARRAK